MTSADLDTTQARPQYGRLTQQRTHRDQLDHGYTAGPMGLNTDGSILVGVDPPVRPGPVIGQSAVEWWKADTRAVVSDGKVTMSGGPSQTFGASACGSPPVWLETHSVDLDHQDRRIWTMLPHQSRPTLLGSSSKMLPGPDPVPVLDLASPVANQRVAYWPIIRQVRGELELAIAGRPLQGTMQPRVYALRAAMPQVLVNGDLIFVRRHREDLRMPTDQVQVSKVSAGIETLLRTTYWHAWTDV